VQLSTMTGVFMHDSFKAMEQAKANTENTSKSSRYAGKRKTARNFVFVLHNMCDLTRRTNTPCTL